MLLFDSHCHLQDERLNSAIGEVVDRALAAGVSRMLCCGSAESDWETVKALSTRYPAIVPGFGLHPWYVKQRSANWLGELEFLLANSPGAAVGEIGLDHARDERNDEEQAVVFLAQLRLARKLHRPVSIHCRKAWGEMVQILTTQCGLPDGGAVHSFSGSPAIIPQLQQLNVSLSFSGSITHDRNKRGRASSIAADDRFLLIETDSPDIAPAGMLGKANEPANLVVVAETAARLRGCPVETIAEITNRNAAELFCKFQVSAEAGPRGLC